MSELVNQEVRHAVFGVGIISFQDERTLSAVFPNHGEKKFVYPDAFEKFLSMSDKKYGDIVSGALAQTRMIREAELARRQEEERARIAEEKEQQAALRRRKAAEDKAAKKAAASAVRAKQAL